MFLFFANTMEDINFVLLKIEREKAWDNCQIVDCNGGSVLPGFIDAHTHPVFAGDRVNEFAMKLDGATYMEVIFYLENFLVGFWRGSILRTLKFEKNLNLYRL